MLTTFPASYQDAFSLSKVPAREFKSQVFQYREGDVGMALNKLRLRVERKPLEHGSVS